MVPYVFDALFLFRCVVSVIGFAVFLYAMRTEVESPARAWVQQRLFAGLLFAVVLAAGIAVMSNPQAVISDEICKMYPWIIECWFPW